MKRLILLALIVLFSTILSAQENNLVLSPKAPRADSTKKITQEIGFNTVSLIKQIISNNPGSTLPQLPYDVFYNLYYEDLIGLRVGLGLTNFSTSTNITGQPAPKTTFQKNLNLRTGISYNFLRTPRLALNVFGDVLLERVYNETTTTTTLVVFPNPSVTQTVKTLDKISGLGAQVGVGVKYNILKHLSVYAEVPIVFLTEKIVSSVSVDRSGFNNSTDNTSTTSITRIIVPTTLYLVLRF